MAETIKEWMSGDPVSITADASALEALGRMQDRGIRHLPVVDRAKRVVGVASCASAGRRAAPTPRARASGASAT
jgi:CBS domain-containing protein